MRILVTGAVGFIGSHTSERLLEAGHTVIGVDNFDPFYDRKFKQDNLTTLKKYSNFSFHELSLEDIDNLKLILSSDIDVVIHLAAKAGVRPSLRSPLAYLQSNLSASVSLMEAMRSYDIKKLVFASSSSVYGKSPEVPFSESSELNHAISVYAASKQSGESFMRMYHNLYDFDVINLRFFTVYGPRQRPDLAIHKFLRANLLGEEITIYGDGSMARDYTYVLDTVSGICGAIDRVMGNSDIFETYNLGNSFPVSLKELITSIEDVTGKKCVMKHESVPPGDVPVTYADISLAKKYLGYEPKTDLTNGLKQMYDWVKEVYKNKS